MQEENIKSQRLKTKIFKNKLSVPRFHLYTIQIDRICFFLYPNLKHGQGAFCRYSLDQYYRLTRSRLRHKKLNSFSKSKLSKLRKACSVKEHSKISCVTLTIFNTTVEGVSIHPSTPSPTLLFAQKLISPFQ